MTLLDECIREASRAPSAHNTQPWDARPDHASGAIDLHVADGRLLTHGDPTGRDALLSLGAWIEHIAIAAATRGYDLSVEECVGLAQFEERPTEVPTDALVRLRLVPGTPSVTWDDEALRRRSVHRGRLRGDAGAVERARTVIREPFRLQDITPSAFARLGAVAAVRVQSEGGVTAELLRWLRFTPEHPDWDRDGLSAAALLLPRGTARLAAVVTRTPRRARTVARIVRALAPALATVRRRAPAPACTGHPVAFVIDLEGGDSADTDGRVPARILLDAGRELCRIWLTLAADGVFVAPRSEIVDDDRSAAALARHLRLGGHAVVLGVWDTGTADTPAPRSARLPVS